MNRKDLEHVTANSKHIVETQLLLLKSSRYRLKHDEDALAACIEAERANEGKPAIGNRYFTKVNNGVCQTFVWEGDKADNEFYDRGECHLTEQACRDADRRRRTLVRLQRLAKASGKFGEWRYYLCWHTGEKEIYVRSSLFTHTGQPCFASEASAEAAREEIGEEDLKFYLLGVSDE